jgi:hypothetical protein
MKGKFNVVVEVEREIDCLGCDRCKEETIVRRKGFLRRKETITTWKCEKLGIPLDSDTNLDSDHMPCDAKHWEQTNHDFSITDEVFTLKFKDAKLIRGNSYG